MSRLCTSGWNTSGSMNRMLRAKDSGSRSHSLGPKATSVMVVIAAQRTSAGHSRATRFLRKSGRLSQRSSVSRITKPDIMKNSSTAAQPYWSTREPAKRSPCG